MRDGASAGGVAGLGSVGGDEEEVASRMSDASKADTGGGPACLHAQQAGNWGDAREQGMAPQESGAFEVSVCLCVCLCHRELRRGRGAALV